MTTHDRLPPSVRRKIAILFCLLTSLPLCGACKSPSNPSPFAPGDEWIGATFGEFMRRPREVPQQWSWSAHPEGGPGWNWLDVDLWHSGRRITEKYSLSLNHPEDDLTSPIPGFDGVLDWKILIQDVTRIWFVGSIGEAPFLNQAFFRLDPEPWVGPEGFVDAVDAPLRSLLLDPVLARWNWELRGDCVEVTRRAKLDEALVEFSLRFDGRIGSGHFSMGELRVVAVVTALPDLPQRAVFTSTKASELPWNQAISAAMPPELLATRVHGVAARVRWRVNIVDR